MRAVSTLNVIGAALWLAASTAHAVGFGRVTNTTQLGQPLNFNAAVILDADEPLPRECVSAEVQSGDNRLQPGQVRVTLEGDSVERNVRVTTSSLIDEPVVTVSVTLGCTAKVTRRFVAFIDPPLINAAQTQPVDILTPQRVDSQVAPIVTMLQNPSSASAAVPRPQRSVPARPRAAVSDPVDATVPVPRAPVATRADQPARPVPPVRQARAPRPAAPGSRLQLETAVPVAAGTAASAATPALVPAPAPATAPSPVPGTARPPAAAPAAMAAASAASSPSIDALTSALAASMAASTARPDAAEALARERQRIQSLEEAIAALRRDSQATQATLGALQARLNSAESERYANPLVYALAWLSALLALAVAALWWRQSRQRQSAQWWTGPVPAAAAPNAPLAGVAAEVHAPQPLGASPAGAVAGAAAGVGVGVGADSEVDSFLASTLTDEDESPPTQSPTVPAPFVATALARSSTPVDEPARELSVEELIDLEQQVEFFIVLGQDEAAIELLMSHVRSDGGISPLPYLKLLEIYRRRGEEEPYQRIRDRFNRRFNSYAPAWDADLRQQGRSLLDYPETIAQLQQLWAAPVRVMETLDASLFRRHKTDETFDLPAYRELLFLYSIARDLAEHAGMSPSKPVDLLLPLDVDGGDAPISHLSATTQSADFQNSGLMTMPLDLDVSFNPTFGPGPVQDLETMPSALRRSDAPLFADDSAFVDLDLDAPGGKRPRAGDKG